MLRRRGAAQLQRAARREEDVLRLDIAVQHALLVAVRNRACDLHDEARCLGLGVRRACPRAAKPFLRAPLCAPFAILLAHGKQGGRANGFTALRARRPPPRRLPGPETAIFGC